MSKLPKVGCGIQSDESKMYCASSKMYNANDIKTVNTNSGNNLGNRSTPNFSELKADEILKQLSINNLDN